MCQKVQYETQASARAAIKRISTRENQSFRAYKCGECDQWHITSEKQRQKNRWLNRKDKYKFRYDPNKKHNND